jgi:hypothetical protein
MSSNCKIERAAGQPSRQSVNLLTATVSASAPHSRGDSIKASVTGHLPNGPQDVGRRKGARTHDYLHWEHKC